MGINYSDYDELTAKLNLADYKSKRPNADDTDTIRDFHNEYSGLFIRKYANIFDIPSEELLFDTSTLTRQCDIDAFGTHESIRTVDVTHDGIILRIKPKEPRYVELITDLAGKIQKTLDYCRDVAEKRSDLRITQKTVTIVDAQ